jgi:hypothetical protein
MKKTAAFLCSWPFLFPAPSAGTAEGSASNEGAPETSRKLLNDHAFRKAVILCDFLGRLSSTFMRVRDQALAV